MVLPTINTRADLDALAGTPAHAAYLAMLAGSLWRLERDDEAQTWVAIEDDTTIARFGFVRAEFPDAVPPALPDYVDDTNPIPASVSMRQARLALLAIGKLADVDAAIAGMDEPAKSAAQIEWEYAATVERASPLIAQLGPALGLDDGQLDALFVQAATL
jgi:hypothetical protein